jgi:AraC family transcriptional regulator
MYLYIDPQSVPVGPDVGFPQADLRPRLLFDDSGLWQTIHKLKAQVGSADPGIRTYAEAHGGLLAHELLRLQGEIPAPRPANLGGLAGWQRKRVMDFMETPRSRSMSDSAERVRSAPSFIGSRGRLQRAIAAALNEPR